MERYDIQRLRELPIESVAERLGLRVSRHKALCPFHDDSHPSLTFSVARNTYKCYACGAHGGTIDLAMKLLPSSGGSQRGTFPEACKWLADEHNVILTEWKPAEKPVVQKSFDASRYSRFFEQPFLNEQARAFLFGERHLDPRVIRWCKLNSFTDRKGISWLQIPYYDLDGKLIGVQSRNLNYGDSDSHSHSPQEQPSPSLSLSQKAPRFRFPQGTQCHIYNLPVLKLLNEGEPLYITEGASDCWSMLSSGHKAIAIPSATLLKPEDLKPLETLNQKLGTAISLHCYPDNDAAGQRLYCQLVELSSSLGLSLTKHDLPPGCKDFSDYYLEQRKR